jgi:hypothetical protein
VEGAVTSFAACELFFFFLVKTNTPLLLRTCNRRGERLKVSPAGIDKEGTNSPNFSLLCRSFIHSFFFFFFLGLTNSLLTFSQEQNTLQTVCDGPDLVRGKDGG